MRTKTALELRVWWGDQLLHVAHVSPPRDVWVGDAAEGAVDYVLPLRRTCVAHVEAGDVAVSSLVLESDAGVYRSAGGGALRVRVAEVEPAEPPPRGSSLSPPTIVAWACSAAVHLALLAGLAACPSDRLEVDTREFCSAIHDPVALATMTELTERASKRVALLPSASGDDLGAAHAGARGTLGATTSPPSSAHFTVVGPAETTEVRLARVRALIESGSYASLSALGALSSATAPGPFGGDDSETIGTDRRSVVGNERGLSADPSLAGTVVVRFIVDATGAMETASLSGGTLEDATVRACILGVFRTLSFPEPESGKVLVSYPIEFQRG